MGSFGEQLVTIALALVSLATVAVLVSRNANTAGVITAGTSGFSQAIAVAVSPVTGNESIGPSGGFTGLNGF